MREITRHDIAIIVLLTAGALAPIVGPRWQLNPHWWMVTALFFLAAGVWAI